LPKKLTTLKLGELSLVDNPANQLAMAPLYKKDDSEGGDIHMEELKKFMEVNKFDSEEEALMALLELFAEEEKATEKAADLKKDNEQLRKALIDNGFVISAEGISKKVEPEFIEYDGEKVNKADIPAPILKKLEEAELEKADAALEKSAKAELPNTKLAVAKRLIDAFGTDEEVMGVLKGADKAVEGFTQEFGKTEKGDGLTSAQEKMDALVAKKATDENISTAKAYAAIAKTDEGKTLVKEIYKEKG
tara:strand:- start:313 stop:1056 length:744 start_codon:yes stop_codon:yes gene_type:complete